MCYRLELVDGAALYSQCRYLPYRISSCYTRLTFLEMIVQQPHLQQIIVTVQPDQSQPSSSPRSHPSSLQTIWVRSLLFPPPSQQYLPFPALPSLLTPDIRHCILSVSLLFSTLSLQGKNVFSSMQNRNLELKMREDALI